MNTQTPTIYQDETARRICPCCKQPTYSPYWEMCQAAFCEYESHPDAYDLPEAPNAVGIYEKRTFDPAIDERHCDCINPPVTE